MPIFMKKQNMEVLSGKGINILESPSSKPFLTKRESLGNQHPCISLRDVQIHRFIWQVFIFFDFQALNHIIFSKLLVTSLLVLNFTVVNFTMVIFMMAK